MKMAGKVVMAIKPGRTKFKKVTKFAHHRSDGDHPRRAMKRFRRLLVGLIKRYHGDAGCNKSYFPNRVCPACRAQEEL